MFAPLLALAAAVCVPYATALAPIVKKGSFLFDSTTGERFYLKGLAYASNYGSGQSTSVEESGQVSKLDPLANGAGCTRDIPYFKQLDVNILRVYQVNSSLDHSTCMEALNSAGIYVAIDLATPYAALSSTSPSWNVELLTDFINTVEAFGSYENVFGFTIGNEVVSVYFWLAIFVSGPRCVPTLSEGAPLAYFFPDMKSTVSPLVFARDSGPRRLRAMRWTRHVVELSSATSPSF